MKLLLEQMHGDIKEIKEDVKDHKKETAIGFKEMNGRVRLLEYFKYKTAGGLTVLVILLTLFFKYVL